MLRMMWRLVAMLMTLAMMMMVLITVQGNKGKWGKERKLDDKKENKEKNYKPTTDGSVLFTLVMKMPLSGKLYALCSLPKHSLNVLINTTLASTLRICHIGEDDRSLYITCHITFPGLVQHATYLLYVINSLFWWNYPSLLIWISLRRAGPIPSSSYQS